MLRWRCRCAACDDPFVLLPPPENNFWVNAGIQSAQEALEVLPASPTVPKVPEGVKSLSQPSNFYSLPILP